MKFGNPKNIEVEVIIQPIQGFIGFGRIRVSVGNLELGDFSVERCSLHHPIEDLERLMNDASSQWDPSFEGMTENQIFKLLDGALFIDSGQSDDQVAADSERYSRFSTLTNTSEHFDGFKVFSYCKSSTIHFVARLPSNDIKTSSCDLASFKQAVSELRSWFDGVCAEQSAQEGRAVKPRAS
jgi:hypothetical protein